MLNTTFLEEFTKILSSNNRFPTKLIPGSKFTGILQQRLKDLGVNFKGQKFTASEVTLYNSKNETLSVYKVKSAMLDLYLFIAILGYLALLWGVIKIFGKPFISKSKKTS